MSTRNRVLFYAVAWFIVLLPFLFWRSTWFGRPLTDGQIAEYLRDESKPRQIQHALVQIGERMARGDKSAAQWYPEMVRLAAHHVEEIRTTDAWLMGQDTSHPQFRDTLKTLLTDSSPLVRSNAALSLVRFGDDAGHDHIVAMLQPTVISAPRAGRITAVAKAGTPINHGTMLARISAGGEEVEVRAPITGRIRSVAMLESAEVAAGAELGVIEPGAEQVWEALRALYLIGRVEDIPAIQPFQRDTPNYPERIVQQAKATEQAIRARPVPTKSDSSEGKTRCIPALQKRDPMRASPMQVAKGEKYRGGPLVAYSILEDGTVTDVRLVRGSGVKDIDGRAVDAVSAWRFNSRPGCGSIVGSQA
ncbi:MAG: TonB family protein, partial [Acidobacteria bacterium]|nr:TonB family protein [Acidobacteriota bacterium]